VARSPDCATPREITNAAAPSGLLPPRSSGVLVDTECSEAQGPARPMGHRHGRAELMPSKVIACLFCMPCRSRRYVMRVSIESLVGVAGIEPATTRFQSADATTTPHPGTQKAGRRRVGDPERRPAEVPACLLRVSLSSRTTPGRRARDGSYQRSADLPIALLDCACLCDTSRLVPLVCGSAPRLLTWT
jgi:hypothetical protein